jgi:hypothetical protein
LFIVGLVVRWYDSTVETTDCVTTMDALQVILLEKLNYNDTILDFLRFTFMVTAIVHWLACGWRMIADDYVNDPHPNWIMETSYIDPSS